ncbi:MAG: mechanosensitive ion channel domain-containing protein [archaeon]
MKLNQWLVNLSNALVNNLTLLKIVTAIIILLIGFIIGRIVGKIVLKLLKEIEFNKNISKAIGHKTYLTDTISNWISYLIYFATIVIAFEYLGLAPFILSFILIIIILVISISIVLSVKDFLPNFVAGYSVRRKGVFKVGSLVQVGEISGKIIKMNLLDTHVETRKKDLMVLPNSYFLKNLVLKRKKR